MSSLISANNFEKEKLSVGAVQNKKSKEGRDYQNIPILYDGKNARVRLSGSFKIKEFGDLSLVAQVDDENRRLFEEIEEEIRTLIKCKSLNWIKDDRVYIKIYNKPNGEMNMKFWELFELDGREYRRPLRYPENLIEKNFEGEVVFRLNKIFVGKVNKGRDYFRSIISVAEELLVREVVDNSYFEEEYPIFEDSEGEDEVDTPLKEASGLRSTPRRGA